MQHGAVDVYCGAVDINTGQSVLCSMVSQFMRRGASDNAILWCLYGTYCGVFRWVLCGFQHGLLMWCLVWST